MQEKKKMVCLKSFLMTLMCVLLAGYVSAQKTSYKELCVGVNGGVTISSVNFTSSKYVVREDKLIQGAGGISVRYISEKNFGVQAELNYSQRGWKEKDPDNPDLRYARALDYLELPIFTHIYFNAGKHFRGVFNLGPQIGYLLNERVLESNVDAGSGDTPPYYGQAVQRKFDWGLCFGAGVEFRSGIGNFVLDGRYYYGLSDIFNNSKSDFFATSSNQIISVKLTYFYSLK